jgi:hypothetical protein
MALGALAAGPNEPSRRLLDINFGAMPIEKQGGDDHAHAEHDGCEHACETHLAATTPSSPPEEIGLT